MSYLSLISCTDRGILWVATRMRSAYSSVSKRETSFSRIALDSAVDTNRSIYPVLEFDTCRGAIANPIVHRNPSHTIGRSSALGTPADQSQDRLKSSVYGFAPYRTTEPLMTSKCNTMRARFSSFAAEALCGVTTPTNTSFARRTVEKTPDIASRTFSSYTDSRVSKAMKARNGRSDFGSWNSTFVHFRSESTFVPSMWRTVLETSAEPNVADSNTRTWFSNAPEGRWGLMSSRRKSALPFRGGTCATPRPRATTLQMIAVRSQST